MKKLDEFAKGKAGEYLVCANLIMQGFTAFPSEQGLPYDVVVEIDSKLYKVQVKTTQGYKNTPQRKKATPAYIFHMGYNGSWKKGKRKSHYDSSKVDLFALVVLDTMEFAYLPFQNRTSTMNFRVPAFKGKYHNEQGQLNKTKVEELKKKGFSAKEISEQTGLSLGVVKNYSAKGNVYPKIFNCGVYFDDFSLAKCLKQMNIKYE